MVEITKKKKDVERFVKLSEERKKVLAMSPEKARDAILDAPQLWCIHSLKRTFIF